MSRFKAKKPICIFGSCPKCGQDPCMLSKPIIAEINNNNSRKCFQLCCVFCSLFTSVEIDPQKCIRAWKQIIFKRKRA